MTNCNNSRPAAPEQERGGGGGGFGKKTRRETSAAANVEDWGISSGIRDGLRGSACLGEEGIWSAGFRTGFFVPLKISEPPVGL
jgi:hypothetical protein